MMGTISSFDIALATIPKDIVNAIQKEFSELVSRFARRDWDPAELKGARFAEAILRYL